jgi:hypothetical protein
MVERHVQKGGQGSGAQPGHVFNGNQYAKGEQPNTHAEGVRQFVRDVGESSWGHDSVPKDHLYYAKVERNFAARMAHLAKTSEGAVRDKALAAKQLHLAAAKAHTAAAVEHAAANDRAKNSGNTSLENWSKGMTLTRESGIATGLAALAHNEALQAAGK